MVKLSEIMSMDLLEQHISNKIVRKATHPDYPELSIYSYTEQATYSQIWDQVTNQCRGLITIRINNIEYVKARGFNKFHNLNTISIPETMEENLPHEDPLVTTKLDGSLGIIYSHDNKRWVATKGSFSSDQAVRATKMLREKYPHFSSMPNVSVLVEIIYPENQIVVNYEGRKELVIIGAVYNYDGHELQRNYCETVASASSMPIVPVFHKTLSQCVAEDNANEEGYVLTYPSNGVKVKVKFVDYCRLHKIITGISPRAIWELVSVGNWDVVRSLEGNEGLPRDFRGWVNFVSQSLALKHAQAVEHIDNQWLLVRSLVASVPGVTRKDFALEILKYQGWERVALFLKLDGKSIDSLIWDTLYPSGTETYREDGE